MGVHYEVTFTAHCDMLQVGDSLPSVTLFEGTPNDKVDLSQVFANKKGVVFAVPGAFTPGCSKVGASKSKVCVKIIIFVGKTCPIKIF